MTASSPIVRAATIADVPALETLIAASARGLGTGYYAPTETEAAIAGVFGVDTELIADGSYFVAEIAGRPVGCGGWSRRRTLFGGDRFAAREAGFLDPATDPAKIRAFFVAPDYARKGIAGALLARCETAAVAAGFAATELMATLPGVPFYAAHGYVATGAVTLDLAGVAVRFIPMSKSLS